MHIHLIRRKAEIAHRQFEVRIGFVDQRLQPRMMLLPVGEAAADDRDVVAFRDFYEFVRVGEG